MKSKLKNPKTIISLVLLALILIFLIQNLPNDVDVTFLQWKYQLSGTFLMLATLIVGFLLGWLTSSLRRRRRSTL